MDIDECIGRLEGYGYVVLGTFIRRLLPKKLYMDGHGLRIGLVVDPGTGVVGAIDCYMLKDGKVDTLLGTTAVYPKFAVRYKWVDGIGTDEMFSALSEPGKAAMRFAAMKLERELGVLEG